jgi:hypothetical protein
VAAIYQAIVEQRVCYIVAPASFETTGQKVRFPGDIVTDKFGNCLDLSLLFSACCEQCGLHPLILTHDGHAYAGCWLEQKTLPDAATDDLQAVRKLVELEELTVWESTTVTISDPGNLPQTEARTLEYLHPRQRFHMVLDIRRARISRIRSLLVPGQPLTNDQSALTDGVKISANFGEREFAESSPSTAEPTAVAPATRIDLWRNKLLDLSLRNRLLNFRETRGTVAVLSANPEHVEDELADNAELKLLPKPRLMDTRDPRNAAAYSQQQKADALLKHLREELQNGRLHTNQDEAELTREANHCRRPETVAADQFF